MKHEVSSPETPPTDLLDLRAFCLVVDLGSITAAARALGETKGSVSRRLSRLERGLGVSLVRRSPRLVQPTENGVAFRARVGRALELLDDAVEAVQECHEAPRGHLRVTAPQDLGLVLLAPLIARFAERYPDVTVEMLLTEKALDFDAHQLDVALRAAESLRDSSLIAHRLLPLAFRFVAAPSYLARHPAPQQPEELSAHRLLLFPGVRRRDALTLSHDGEERRTSRVRLQPGILASDGSFIREVALAGGGVALLPTVLVERDLAEGRLAPVLPGWQPDLKGTLYLLHPAMQFVPPKIRAFREFLVQELASGEVGAGPTG